MLLQLTSPDVCMYTFSENETYLDVEDTMKWRQFHVQYKHRNFCTGSYQWTGMVKLTSVVTTILTRITHKTHRGKNIIYLYDKNDYKYI